MKLYHEASRAAINSILSEGLKRTSRGEKGGDDAIIRTDKLIDECRTPAQTQLELSRDNNLYAYVGTDDFVVDIADGRHTELDRYSKSGTQVLLELDVDETKAFVSDLDIYDAIRRGVAEGMPLESLKEWAKKYWESMIRLDNYHLGAISRPEVMITYDIQPHCMRVVH